MFSKPNAIVYLRRNNVFIAGKHVQPANFSISSDIVNNMEILNREQFIATCGDFFKSHGVEGKKVLVVLDQGIVFAKTLILKDSDKEATRAAINTFIASIPFESGQRAFEQLETDDQLELYATNSDLYQAIVETLEHNKVKKIIAVTPSFAYRLDKGLKPAESIAQFLNNKEIRNIADFLASSPL